MMNLNAFYAALSGVGLLWYECGDDFGVFCYRIGCGVFSAARERVFGLVPLRATMNPVRTIFTRKNALSRCNFPSRRKKQFGAPPPPEIEMKDFACGAPPFPLQTRCLSI